jgi:DNA-binding NarL/FixJ family response regulator
MPGRSYRFLVCHPDPRERADIVRRLETLSAISGITAVESLEALTDDIPEIVFFRPTSAFSVADTVFQNRQGQSGPFRLIALITVDESDRIPHLFQAGLVAFILPDAAADAFEAAARSVRHGGIYLARELADALFSPGRNRQQYIAAIGLTAREQEVLRLIAVNMSNKDIARRLDLSVRTVETHRLNIRKKTNAGNWRELAVIAERLGLLGDYDLFAGLAERPAATGFHEE